MILGFDPKGKTLSELAEKLAFSHSGYAIYVLNNDGNPLGNELCTGYDLGSMLKKHPEARNCKVEKYNNFFGMTVFRVKRPMTNGDRIRAMTDDDELTTEIHAISLGYRPWCDYHCEDDCDDGCENCIKAWCQQPVKEDGE